MILGPLGLNRPCSPLIYNEQVGSWTGRSLPVRWGRKVRTPQSSVPDNVREAVFKRGRRKVPQKTNYLAVRWGKGEKVR